jgi:hypothetical protein
MDIQKEANISLIAEKIIKQIQAPFNVSVRDLNTSMSIKASIRISIFPKHGTDAVEQATPAREVAGSETTRPHSEFGRTAALDGAELLRLGYSIDQVVHEYGDICQSVTAIRPVESEGYVRHRIDHS